MRFLLWLSMGLFVLLIGGCATSKVVLLEGTKTNTSVIVKTQAGEQILDTPNTYTELRSKTSKPTHRHRLTQSDLEEQYGSLIRFAPKPPVSFLLYFKSGMTTLVPDSAKLLPFIEQTIKERAPCDVTIIGHTDTEGAAHYNMTLSKRRAQSVYDTLLQRRIDVKNATVEYYGQTNLLIPTKENVSEPRNRRVEVLIR
jgi:outer membrane protein OmpA-like peptidoglycan-associated protein